MALILKDRVLETSQTSGTGTLTLAGAVIDFQSFSSAIGNGNTTYYTISDDADNQWEVGIGTVGAGTLTRDTVLASSNSGSKVNFGSSIKNVFCDYPASKSVYQDANGLVTVPNLATNSASSLTPVLTYNASNSAQTNGATVAGSYLQNVMQNKSGTAGASTNFAVSNDLGTDSTYYGEFGMNSSVFSSGTPSDYFSLNNGIYFSGHDGDITYGSGNGYKTFLAWGTTGDKAHVINASGAIGLNTNITGTTNFGTSGQVLTSGGSAATPTWTSLSGTAVTSISFGTTGLTPATATTGAVTVAGTLAVANGGTGLTTLTAGYIPFGAGTSAFGSSANLFWDSTNSRLGIGTSSPSYQLDVVKASASTTQFRVQNTTTTAQGSNLIVSNDAGTNIGLGVFGSTAGTAGMLASSAPFLITAYTELNIVANNASGVIKFASGGTTERMRIDSNGLVGIGLTPSGTTVKLQVSTDALISGLTVGKGGGAVASNTAIGVSALQNNTTASNNTGIGYQAGITNSVGVDNFFGGYQAGYAATSNYNVIIGSSATTAASTGGSNVAIGFRAAQANTSGQLNVSVGRDALYTNSSGSGNVALGYAALNANTTASNNTAVGYQAGYSNQTGIANSILGYQAGYNTTSGGNTFMGYAAGYTTTAADNTFIGLGAGNLVSTGTKNTFIGVGQIGAYYGAGSAVTTGSKNTIIGGYNGNQGGLDIRTASNYIVLSDGDGNPRQVIDGSGNFIVGDTTNYGVRSLIAGVGAATSTGGGSNNIVLALRDTTAGAAGVGAGIAFLGNDGTNTGVTFGTINATKEVATSGNYASSLTFKTRANGASLVEQMRIDSSGNVTLQKNISVGGATPTTSGAGVTFPATQSASTDANTLDDYEEGTWTPIDSSGASLSFTGVVGTYTKIGRCVTVLAELTYPATASASSAVIGGLPFTSSSSGAGIYGYIRYTTVANTVLNYISGSNSATTVSLFRPGVNVTNVSMSSATLLFAAIYYV